MVSGLRILLASFTEVKSLGLGGWVDHEEAGCVWSLLLNSSRKGHSRMLLKWLLPLFNNIYFQECPIYICPTFLTIV